MQRDAGPVARHSMMLSSISSGLPLGTKPVGGPVVVPGGGPPPEGGPVTIMFQASPKLCSSSTSAVPSRSSMGFLLEVLATFFPSSLRQLLS